MAKIKDYKLAYEALKRVHDAANRSIDKLKIENEGLKEKVDFLLNVNTSLNDKVNTQKMIMTTTITEGNQKQQELGAEIERLRGVIGELRGK